MITATKIRTVYGAFVYHDEDGDANTDSQFIGWRATVDEAAFAIRGELGGYWHYGSVHAGSLERRPWPQDDDFVSDEYATPWQVGTNYCERG